MAATSSGVCCTLDHAEQCSVACLSSVPVLPSCSASQPDARGAETAQLSGSNTQQRAAACSDTRHPQKAHRLGLSSTVVGHRRCTQMLLHSVVNAYTALATARGPSDDATGWRIDVCVTVPAPFTTAANQIARASECIALTQPLHQALVEKVSSRQMLGIKHAFVHTDYTQPPLRQRT